MLFLLNWQLRACASLLGGSVATLFVGRGSSVEWEPGKAARQVSSLLHNPPVSNALEAAAEMPAEAEVKAPGTNALTSRSRLRVCVP